jgi:hypothetical protein
MPASIFGAEGTEIKEIVSRKFDVLLLVLLDS